MKLVRCTIPWVESSIPTLAERPKVGSVYLVVGVRDADLGLPQGKIPDEIAIRTTPNGFTMWYSSYHFEALT